MASFYEMLQSAIGPEKLPGVHLAPEIPPKKLIGAQKYARYGQETPLALFDNTTFGSGKSGALITDFALYVSTTKDRYDLSVIRMPPTFDDLDGFLQTPVGRVKIPRLVMTESQEAFERVFQVILSVNLGTSGDEDVLEGPLGELARHALQGPKIEVSPRLPRHKLKEASLLFPDWCDWLTGERILAYIDETTFGKGDEGLVFTDRRLLGHIGNEDWNIPYASITGASTMSGALGQNLLINTTSSVEKIKLATAGEACQTLVAFFQGISQLPLEQRRAPTPSYATAEDPTGVEGLMSRVPGAEPRTLTLLQLIRAHAAGGVVSIEVLTDLVARIGLLTQTLAYGHGAQQGWFLSPLPADDLIGVLTTFLGAPLAIGGDETTRLVDFSMEKSGGWGGAAVSSAVGIAALAVVGVGWVSTPGKKISTVRISMQNRGVATAFMPLGSDFGTMVPLAQIDAKLAAQVLSVLENTEALGLLARTLWGWETPAQALLQHPRGVMQQQAEMLIGQADLSTFFPEQV